MAHTFGAMVFGLIFEPFAGLEYIFVFEDGSELVMTAPRGNGSRLKLSYQPSSSKDVDGNIIADAGGSFSGNYMFLTQDSMDNFLQRASLYGVKIVRVSQGGGGSAGVVYFVILSE